MRPIVTPDVSTFEASRMVSLTSRSVGQADGDQVAPTAVNFFPEVSQVSNPFMFSLDEASSAQLAFAVLSRPRTGIAGLLQ